MGYNGARTVHVYKICLFVQTGMSSLLTWILASCPENNPPIEGIGLGFGGLFRTAMFE